MIIMLDIITEMILESIDVEEKPELELGTNWYVWMDGWECVELVDCEPKGWGWCTVGWFNHKGYQTKSLPIIQLNTLDWVLDHDPEFAKYEYALARADAMED
jgi:hypothetical protein